MKKILFVLSVFCLSNVFAQNNVKVEEVGELTKATYYYDDGSIQQQGTFNADGELHGTWTSYDFDGNKLAVGQYTNGNKTGKWFFWSDSMLKEVDFVDSRIASVSEWKSKTSVVIRE